MTLADLVALIAQISGLLLVVTSMLAVGMSLTIQQILKPLSNVRLVVLALLANFVLVPLLAYVLTQLFPLEQPLKIGLVLLATGAGAPFLAKLAQGAKGDMAFGVGLMVLLMVVTIVYMPLILPLLLPGVAIDPWEIAKSLIGLMLVPLAIGLLFKSHSPEDAAHWQPTMNKISGLALLVLLVTGLGLNLSAIIDFIGSLGLLALVLFILGCLLIGYVLGGKEPRVRSVHGLGTAERNISAAIVVTAQNFAGTDTLPFVLVASILMLLILLPVAKRFGTLQELRI